MYKISILVNDQWKEKVFSETHYSRLRELGEVHIYRGDERFSDKPAMLDFVKDTDVLITSWRSPAVDAEILDACPGLLGVIHAAGSVKKVVTPELISRGVRLTSASNELSRGVAETTLGAAIAACKGMFTLTRDTRNGLWRENFNTITDFYGIKIGVIGAGCAGRHFIDLLRAFRVDVFVYDPYVSEEEIRELGAEKCELSYLMSECDVISIHAPSVPETDNMINRENLRLIKDGAVLINTARGSLINEQDLVEECRKGRFMAVLDVTNPEPPAKDSELRSLPNIVLFPHIAGVTTNGVRRIGEYVCKEAALLISGKRMMGEIDFSRLSVMA